MLIIFNKFLQLSVRGKNKKEKLETFLRSFSKTTDEILLGSTQKDVDEFFDKEKNFLLDYHSLLKDATLRADKMTKAHKGMAVFTRTVYWVLRYWKWDFVLSRCGRSLYQNLFVFAGNGYGRHKSIGTFCHKIFGYLWKGQGKSCSIDTRSYIHLLKIIHFYPEQKIENRVSTDEDLKLSDTLRYYMRDTTAAKNLLYRRLRCLADYEAANRALEKARAKNKDVHAVSVSIWFTSHEFVSLLLTYVMSSLLLSVITLTNIFFVLFF